MSGGLLKYSGLVTKTRAMHGRLLGEEAFSVLAEFSTVEEIISFLRESAGYAPTYKSHEEIVHRAQVEAVMDDSLYADYGKLFCFANREQRKGLEIIFFRYEVNVLKTSLEYACKGGRKEEPANLNLFFERHAGFDTKAVTSAASLRELSAALAGTKYEQIFSRFTDSSNMSIADCASQLDVYYYQSAWRMKDKLPDGGLRRIFTRILGTEIDWQNIMWMYRYKHYYNGKPGDIYANTIPIFYRLKKTEFQRLLETETAEEFLKILGGTAYFTEKDAVVKMGDEITFRRIMDRTYQQMGQKYPMSIAPVLNYLYDKENEIDILTTILEGVRYQIPAIEIRDMILNTA